MASLPSQSNDSGTSAIDLPPERMNAVPLATHIMGFRLDEIGYLHYCRLAGMGVAELSEMDIRGDDVEACILPFKPHHTYQDQLKWRDESLRDLVPHGSFL